MAFAISYLQNLFCRRLLLFSCLSVSIFAAQAFPIIFVVCDTITFKEPPARPPLLFNGRHVLSPYIATGRQISRQRSPQYTDAIFFPETVFPSLPKIKNKTTVAAPDNLSQSRPSPQDGGRIGAKCITRDGKQGICRTTHACETAIHFQLAVTHRECGTYGDLELICCPQRANINEKQRPHSVLTTQLTNNNQPSSVSILPNNNNRLSNSGSTNNNNLPTKTLNTQFGQSTPLQNGDLFANIDEVQDVCGVYENGGENTNTRGENLAEAVDHHQQTLLNGAIMWPWIVSIGRRHSDGSINFRCLGSLITKEYIISTAECVQRNPNVILVGQAYLGFLPADDNRYNQPGQLQELLNIDFHEKYSSFSSYQNIGIARLTHPIVVRSSLIPVCFPFLAGVLDIIPFSGMNAKTVGFETSESIASLSFGFEEYTILNNTHCSKIFDNNKAETVQRFPSGIRGDNMCGSIETTSTLCQAPGAPLIHFDTASESHVIIGISTGDPTCDELKRQVVTFTRLNAFSTWVRERVGKLPEPPPCYVN